MMMEAKKKKTTVKTNSKDKNNRIEKSMNGY